MRFVCALLELVVTANCASCYSEINNSAFSVNHTVTEDVMCVVDLLIWHAGSSEECAVILPRGWSDDVHYMPCFGRRK